MRQRGKRVTIPARVYDGLRTLTEHANAGGPDDLEIDVESPEGEKSWENVQQAIAWMRWIE